MIREESVIFKVLRNGAEFAILYAANSAPTLRLDNGGEIKSSLKGTFLAQAFSQTGEPVEIDWLTDEIEPVLVIDGVESPLGILIPTTVTTKTTGTGKTVDVEAYDRCWLVKNTIKQNLAYFAAETKYLTAIGSLLTEAGITNVSETETDATLPEAREDWDIGTPNLSIVNQLLDEINYKQLWFDQQGLAVLEPYTNPTAENIEHILTTMTPDPRNKKEVGIINVLPTISQKTDIYDAPNVFMCICSNADKSSGMVATAENTNPQSPLSIQSRGRRIVHVEKLNNIASQAELEVYATRMASESLLTGETISVQTLLYPGFGAGDITAIQYGSDILSICVETGWTMELKPGGLMTHQLERVVLNLE